MAMHPFAVSALFSLRVNSVIMAILLASFGFILLVNPDAVIHLAGRQFLYVYLLRIASPWAWGTTGLAVGFIRVVALLYGIVSPRSMLVAAPRILGSTFGAFFWFQIMFGSFHTDSLVPAMAVYTTFFTFEILNIYYAVLESFINESQMS